MTITGLAIVVALIAVALLLGVILGVRLATGGRSRELDLPFDHRDFFDAVAVARAILAEFDLQSPGLPPGRKGKRGKKGVMGKRGNRKLS